MAIPTLAQLFTALTKDQIVASVLQVAQTVGLPITAWQPQSVGREIIEVNCQQMSNFSAGGSLAAAGGLLDYARGDWLTLTANQFYVTDRIAATFGTCNLTLSNASASPFTLAAGDVRVYNSRTGATYSNSSGGTLPPQVGVTPGTLNVSIIADESGSGSNANTGEINQFVTPPGAGVTCSNTEPLVGTDAEDDDALIVRCRASVAKLSPNGPRDAYNYYAMSTLRGDGTNCGVTRTRTYQPVGQPGVVIVYLASASGIVQPSDVTLVQANLIENVVPTGITTTAVSAVEKDIPVSATIYLKSGSTLAAATMKQTALDALTAYFAAIPIGGISLGGDGFVFLDALISVFFAASNQVVNAVITNYSTDIAMNPSDVPVLTSTVASFNVVYAP